MAQKKYIFLNHKSLRMIVQPVGKKDAQGNKIPGKTIEFTPDPVTREAMFITSDESMQKFIEKSDKFQGGRIIIDDGKPASRNENLAPEPTSSQDGLKAPEDKPQAPAVGGKGRGARK